MAAYYRDHGMDTSIRIHVRLYDDCHRPAFYKQSPADFNVLLTHADLERVQVLKKKSIVFDLPESAKHMWLGWPQNRPKNVGRVYALTRPQMDMLLQSYTGSDRLLERLATEESSIGLYEEAVAVHSCLLGLWAEDKCFESSAGHSLSLDRTRPTKQILDHLQYVLVETLSQAVADMDMTRPRLSLLEKPVMPVEIVKPRVQETRSCDDVLDSFCRMLQKESRNSESGKCYRLF